jgi:hypothetical protein
MAEQQSHKIEVRTHEKGVNRDIEPEFLSADSGTDVDAANMRSTSVDGFFGAKEKIRGEELEYPAIDNACFDGTGGPLGGDYFCIASQRISGRLFEVLADRNLELPPIIRLDGEIVLRSPNFPARYDFPFQLDYDEDCAGGEVYLTDYRSEPMYFNIDDLWFNRCTPKYFSEFDINQHTIILRRPVNIPVFVQLASSIANADEVFLPEDSPAGLPVGYYSYSIRYSTASGEKTQWSQATPQIPVVNAQGLGCDPAFPRAKTYGGPANTTSPSTLGVHLRLRVNNESGYDFVQVRRTRWNAEDGLGVLPVSDVCGEFSVTPGQLSVVNMLDLGGFIEELTDDESTEVMAAIRRAKAIRYFASKLYLMNVEYASRDIENNYQLVDDDNPVVPVVRKMGKGGHASPWHATYHKHLQTLEKYGWAVVFWDDQGNYTFADPIENAENIQQPHRRDAMPAESRSLSYYGVVRAARVNGTVGDTFEVFDLKDAVRKSDASTLVNIADVSGLAYNPLRPTRHVDGSCAGHNYLVNLGIEDNGIAEPYTPKGFAPNYFSHGVAFKGISSLPSWASAFSVVRTRPAGKVVAQGIAHYRLQSGSTGFGANTTKATDRVWAHFPDADPSTGLSPQLLEAIQANPSAYKIVAVSPLGFFTEIYNFRRESIAGFQVSGDRCVDLITYARILAEEIDPLSLDATINPLDVNQGIVDSFTSYVGYGNWRRENGDPQTNGPFPNGTGGDQEFDITGINITPPQAGRGNYAEITLGQTIYWHATTNTEVQGDSQGARRWHEPFYIINIIRVTADVPESNLQSYVNTGHHQKVKSLIGVSNGSSSMAFQTVDERWEDFTHYESAIPAPERLTNPFLISLERFIFVQNPGDLERRWLNVNEKTTAQVTAILSDIEASGFHVITDASGTYEVYGIYQTVESATGEHPSWEIQFSQQYSQAPQGQVPQFDASIYVRYDSRIPVRVFGGDTWVNEAIWAPIDLRYGPNGEPEDNTQQFILNVPFPYREYTVNGNYRIIDNADGALGANLQTDIDFKFSASANNFGARIRQMVNMYCCETKVNLSFFYNRETDLAAIEQSYPKKHYVMRPNRWNNSPDPADFYSENNINAGYAVDYGDEFANWNYGGFRFLPQVNIDYSKEHRDGRRIVSKPSVGFIEKTLFCGRIHWSLQRDPESTSNPGLRTFLESNFYDLPTNNGPIKLAYDCNVDNMGSTLYAFTDSGIAMLLVDKRFLSEVDGADLAQISGAIGVLQHRWVSSSVGLSDEMWRGFADFNNFCYFPGRLGVWMMRNNQITPIIRLGYNSKIQPILDDFSEGYTDHMTAIFNVRYMEYMLTVKRGRRFNIVELVSSLANRGIVDSIPNDAYPESVYVFPGAVPIGSNTLINVQCDLGPGVQGPLVLGGPTGLGLTQDVIICNLGSSANQLIVEFRNAALTWVSAAIPPGECRKFKLESVSNPAFSPYFTIEEYEFEQPIPFLSDGNETFIFDSMNNAWQGSTSHQYDKYTRAGNDVYGHKNGEVYLLDRGRILNGELIEAHYIGVCVGVPGDAEEFIRIRVNSDNKPVKIRFYLTKEDAINDNFVCELDAAQIKDRRGFEQYVPRQIQSRLRVQGRILFYRVIHNLDEDFKVVTTQVQHKTLK